MYKVYFTLISVSDGSSQVIRFYKVVKGNDMNCHEAFLGSLSVKLREVLSVDQSDVMIVFVPIVSRAGTDIKAALETIPGNCSQEKVKERLIFFSVQALKSEFFFPKMKILLYFFFLANRPVVFVVLHHTFDPEYTVPESRKVIGSRSNVWPLDCLFYEDQGLLKCHRNTKALEATANYLQDIKMRLMPGKL